MIEQSIFEIERLLVQPERPTLNRIEGELSMEEVEQLNLQKREIHSTLKDVAEKYHLTFYEKNQRAMIRTRLSHMLDVTEDMYPEKLKGYGAFNPEVKERYNNDIKRLERVIKQAFTNLSEPK
jgi:hypothetical protein